jgi:hypothetical protein
MYPRGLSWATGDHLASPWNKYPIRRPHPELLWLSSSSYVLAMSSPSNAPISPLDEEKLPNTNIDTVDTESSTPGRPPAIDPALEKALLRKLDIHVVIPLTILFLLAFLDRVNIGNAKIQGMTQDLHMQGNDYNIALLIFFPP